MNLLTFNNELRNGLVEWASVRKIQNFVNSGGELQSFNLSTDEMLGNAGELTDKEFSAKFNCKPRITHATRVELIMNGVQESKRFASTIQTFNTMDQKDKTVREVNRILGNVESSKPGQDALRKEILEGRSKKKQKIEDTQVNLTIAAGKQSNPSLPQKKTFPPGSCSVHPLNIYHNNAMCRDQHPGSLFLLFVSTKFEEVCSKSF
jgi:hypothetical protein